MHLVDDAVGAFGAGEEAHAQGGRVGRDEEVGVEAAEGAGAAAACEGGDVCVGGKRGGLERVVGGREGWGRSGSGEGTYG